MPECLYCHKILGAKTRRCPHCGQSYPTGRPIYTFPALLVAFVVCSVICFYYLRQYTGLADGWCAALALPVVWLLFAGLIKLGTFCG